MKSTFKLNDHNRATNPRFEAHDPSMMWDPLTNYYYSYSTDTAITSKYQQGIPIRKSKDLVNFEFIGYALSEKAIEEGRDNGQYPPTNGFWAPYVYPVILEDGTPEYRMYYSATKAFGSSESRIWLATAKSPEGPFDNRGVVMDTWETDDTFPNAIDAHVIVTPKNQHYMIYGSYFGGIFLKELDPEIGLAINNDTRELGTLIAKKPENSHIDGPEGAAIEYVEGYYYLFLSYGWLGDDYDVRVGRSTRVEGPYLDYHGHSLVTESRGLKMIGSYKFSAKNPQAGKDDENWEFNGFRGPGHGVPFHDIPNNRYFFVHHVRDGANCFRYEHVEPTPQISYKMHYMMIRPMFFLNQWPIMSPEPYEGEPNTPILMTHNQLLDRLNKNPANSSYEWLMFSDENNDQIIGKKTPLPIVDPNMQWLSYDTYDYENGRNSTCYMGITPTGETIWVKS